MEDLKEFYADRMKKWEERKDLVAPPRLTLDKLLEKAEEKAEDKDKIDLLKRIAEMLGLKVEDVFK